MIASKIKLALFAIGTVFGCIRIEISHESLSIIPVFDGQFVNLSISSSNSFASNVISVQSRDARSALIVFVPSAHRSSATLFRMKLLVVIVQDADAAGLVKEFTRRHLEVTKLASTGGFLREGNTTLLIGVDDDKLEIAKDVIREKCRSRTRFVTPGVPVAEQPEPFLAQPVEVPVGGAVAFVLNVEEFFKV